MSGGLLGDQKAALSRLFQKSLSGTRVKGQSRRKRIEQKHHVRFASASGSAGKAVSGNLV
jgi:hypothetical protein